MFVKKKYQKQKINGVEYYLEEAIWAEVFDEKLLNKGLELENMTIEEIETTAIGCIEKAFERMKDIKTNGNMPLFIEEDIEEAEIVDEKE